LSGSNSTVYIDPKDGPIVFYVNGDLKNSAQAKIIIKNNNFPVVFFINGNCDMEGGGIFNLGDTSPAAVKPQNLAIIMCKANTTLDLGGSPMMGAHIYAPGSDLKFHGNGNGIYGYWGSAIGKSLTVDGGFELHYDETQNNEPKPYKVHLVE